MKKAAAKGSKSLGFIKRNIRSSRSSTRELAYKALVRPTVEYASSVWSPHQGELKYAIERVQRRAARYVTKRYDRLDSVTDMLNELTWETLEQRRKKARVVMGYRIIHGLVAISSQQLQSTEVRTRGHSEKYRQIPARTNYYKHTFFPSFIPLWNSLPPEAVSAGSLEVFKSKLADVHLA